MPSTLPPSVMPPWVLPVLRSLGRVRSAPVQMLQLLLLLLMYLLIAMSPAAGAEVADDLHHQQLLAMLQTLADPAQALPTTLVQLANLSPLPAEWCRIACVLMERGDTPGRLAGLQLATRVATNDPAAARPLASRIEGLLTDAVPVVVRGQALAVLASLGPPLPPVPSAMRAQLADQGLSGSLRARSASILGAWPDPDGATAGALAVAMMSCDRELAGAAAESLGCLVHSPVGQAQRDGEWLAGDLHAQAALIAALAASHQASLHDRDQAVAEATRGPCPGLRMAAMHALAMTASGDPRVVRLLIDLAGCGDPACERLGRQGLLGDVVMHDPGLGSSPAAIVAAVSRLASSSEAVRAVIERALIPAGPRAACATPQVIALLEAHPSVAIADLAAATSLLSAIPGLSLESRTTLASWLDPRAAVYRERSHREVEAIQALLLSALAATGPPPSSRRWILAAVASPDGECPWAFAAAARAAAREGPAAAYAITALQAALSDAFVDAEIDLDHPAALLAQTVEHGAWRRGLSAQSPSARSEAIQALAAIGVAAAPALPALRRLICPGLGGVGNQQRLQREAQRAIGMITGLVATAAGATARPLP